jgi:hypothetical protein
MTTTDTPTNPPLRLRAGGYYRTRGGRRVGPLEEFGVPGHLKADVAGELRVWRTSTGAHEFNVRVLDIVAEWTEPAATPVQTHTTVRTEIQPGTYGPIWVGEAFGGTASVGMHSQMWAPEDLRAAAAVLTQLADGLDRIAEERNEPK